MISQRELGKRSAGDGGKAIHWVTVSRLERGGVASWDTTVRLARALGIDARWLMESLPPAQVRLDMGETKLSR